MESKSAYGTFQESKISMIVGTHHFHIQVNRSLSGAGFVFLFASSFFFLSTVTTSFGRHLKLSSTRLPTYCNPGREKDRGDSNPITILYSINVESWLNNYFDATFRIRNGSYVWKQFPYWLTIALNNNYTMESSWKHLKF